MAVFWSFPYRTKTPKGNARSSSSSEKGPSLRICSLDEWRASAKIKRLSSDSLIFWSRSSFFSLFFDSLLSSASLTIVSTNCFLDTFSFLRGFADPLFFFALMTSSSCFARFSFDYRVTTIFSSPCRDKASGSTGRIQLGGPANPRPFSFPTPGAGRLDR